jgi:hypothetical protein
MTVIRPGRGVHISADKLINHAKPHYQGGLVGVVQKQDQPGSFDSLASRTQVQAGVKYFLLTKGETEQDAIAGAVLGSPVFITKADDTLVLADAGAATVPFGRVTGLPGQFGLPAGRMRIDMDLKDNVVDA